MHISDVALPSQALISENNRLFYALGVNPKNGEIFVCDAIDYVQAGVVYRYDKSGQEIHSFHTGIIPGHIFFK